MADWKKTSNSHLCEVSDWLCQLKKTCYALLLPCTFSYSFTLIEDAAWEAVSGKSRIGVNWLTSSIAVSLQCPGVKKETISAWEGIDECLNEGISSL